VRRLLDAAQGPGEGLVMAVAMEEGLPLAILPVDERDAEAFRRVM